MFTFPKVQTILKDDDYIRYRMYGSHFTSSYVASIAFRLVKKNKIKDLLIKYMSQVDKVNNSKDLLSIKYDHRQ